MGSDENSRTKSDQEVLGELLKARVQSFRDEESTSPRSLTCSECGTQLSDASEFCWMCGATRKSAQPFLVSSNHRETPPAEAETVVHRFAPPVTPPNDVSAHAGSFTPGAYSSAATAAAPIFDSPVTQPAVEPALFRKFYADLDRETDADEDRPRRFDYKILVLALLLVVLGVLGYRQRESAKVFYRTARQVISEQFAQIWGSTQAPVAQPKSATAAQSPAKLHAKASRRSITRSPESSALMPQTVAGPRASSFLRVRVDGQPGPDMISSSHVGSFAFMGDVTAAGPQIAMASIPTPVPFAVTISPRESLSLLLKQVQPSYPAAARAVRAKGPVVLKAVIHRDGNVGDLSVVAGHPLLRQAAIDAVRQWVYRPYYRYGEPTEVETLVVVDFAPMDRAEVGARQHPGN